MHKLAGKDTACVRDMGWDKPILRAEHCWQTRRKRYRLFLMCIYIYIYIYIYIQTSRKYPVPSSSLYAFLLTARVALTVSSGGSYARGLIRLVRLGVDPWRYQVAKCAFSAGPEVLLIPAFSFRDGPNLGSQYQLAFNLKKHEIKRPVLGLTHSFQECYPDTLFRL